MQRMPWTLAWRSMSWIGAPHPGQGAEPEPARTFAEEHADGAAAAEQRAEAREEGIRDPAERGRGGERRAGQGEERDHGEERVCLGRRPDDDALPGGRLAIRGHASSEPERAFERWRLAQVGAQTQVESLRRSPHGGDFWSPHARRGAECYEAARSS